MNNTESNRTRLLDLQNRLPILVCILIAATAYAQTARSIIRLAKQSASEERLQNLPESETKLLAKMPLNSYHFGSWTQGVAAEPQRLTLEFSAASTITAIASTPDFKVMPGGTCEKGRSYQPFSSCELLVAFTPQGAGHRMGKLTVTHTASNSAQSFALTGFAYVPVVSFVPSVISTVPATASAGSGLISGARNIAIDSGDILYLADTGNNRVGFIDSSGKLTNLATGYTAPNSVTVDTFGEVYFALNGSNNMYEVYDYGPVVQVNGTGTASCTYSAPCNLNSEAPGQPAQLSTDGNNNLFFADSHRGAALVVAQPLPATMAFLYDPFPYQTNPVSAFAIDRNDNLYSMWANGGVCEIVSQTLSDAANSNVRFTKIVGGHTCGFSGDGGEAGGAEIGAQVGQIAFDVAGNIYFSDTANNRVRRIDALTGIIHTIAGNGTTGDKGDNGSAIGASVGAPAGVSADSQGQVYILASSPTAGATQVVRKVGTMGILTFPATGQGKSSSPLILNVSNTGTTNLNFLRNTITGANAADFTIDPNTTSCNFSAGNNLYAGQSCQIGVIFTPSAVGARSATLTLVDNTVTGTNAVKLTGTATLAATVKFTTPSAGQKIASGTTVKLAVKVTSAAPAPTGNVRFLVDGKFVAAAAITAGSASVNAGTLAVGTHKVTANYVGDKYHSTASASETISIN